MRKCKANPELPANSESQFEAKPINRRSFLGNVGYAAAATVTVGALGSPKPAAAQSASSNATGVPAPQGVTNPRVLQAFELRVKEAVRDSLVHAAPNVSNGDLARYADKGGTYTKALPHDSFGRVDLSAFSAFTTALASGKFSDFQKIPMGGTRTLNGPQGGLAFDMECLDAVQFGQPLVPPLPELPATKTPQNYWNTIGLPCFAMWRSPITARVR